MKQWFVAEVTRKGLSTPDKNHQERIAAAVAACALGFEVFVPFEFHRRVERGRIIETQEPRYGAYIFLRFDRETDRYAHLYRERNQFQYFKGILSDHDDDGRPRPTPVPDRAMEAIKSYRPRPIIMPEPITYQPGQRVVWTIAGMRREGVFIEYCGDHAKIRTWIFGAERICPIAASDLEPLELDNMELSTP